MLINNPVLDIGYHYKQSIYDRATMVERAVFSDISIIISSKSNHKISYYPFISFGSDGEMVYGNSSNYAGAFGIDCYSTSEYSLGIKINILSSLTFGVEYDYGKGLSFSFGRIYNNNVSIEKVYTIRNEILYATITAVSITAFVALSLNYCFAVSWVPQAALIAGLVLMIYFSYDNGPLIGEYTML